MEEEIGNSPANQIFGLVAEVDVIREHEVVLPMNDLLVRLMCGFGAERWVADKTFEHDRAE